MPREVRAGHDWQPRGHMTIMGKPLVLHTCAKCSVIKEFTHESFWAECWGAHLRTERAQMTYRDYHHRPSFDRQFAESESERNERLRKQRLSRASTPVVEKLGTAAADTSGASPDREATAKNCANWKDGTCETCGVPWQYFEVSADYKCKNFKRRDG